ncbi:MAG: glycosyl hydrolase 115 family protein, partial [Bacteroidota bacterium]|nr:glycosyl hydrolase 115 family protein [Bacteroidota bacterium]
MIKSIPFFLFAIFICSTLQANFIFRQNTNISVVFNEKKEPEVVRTAFDLFKTDYSKVFSGNLTIGSKGILYFGTVELNDKAEKFVDKNDILELKKHKEGFLITVKKGNLIVLGSDKRGTAYGILEISRMIGVSPWVWWADSRIDKKESFTLEEGFRMLKYPSVAHRGIFLNDEDWGLMPWSSLTYEPSQKKGQIGPKTHARILELLLRLRANSFWPARHSCSVA